MKPNILWICTDQQRFDSLGCYGNEWVTTPNINHLAGEGSCFELAFSQSPVCTPSRGAFLTGRYPRTCCSRQNGAAIPETEVRVTRLFADAGYHCGLSGKLHLCPCFPKYLGPGGREARIDDGYEVFRWSHGSGSMGIAQNDYHVGRMLDALEETGQRKKTIVIFTSDHGELLGDHGIYFKGPFFYDCSVRVPLIISMPGTVRAQRSSGLVELLDLPQTILEAAGIDAHPGMMGKSLWSILTGTADPDEHRPDVYCESYTACEGHNGEAEQPAYATMVRTATHKLVLAHGHGTGELYDLSEDAGEHRNLWDDPHATDLKTDMLVCLADRQAFTLDPLPERVAPW